MTYSFSPVLIQPRCNSLRTNFLYHVIPFSLFTSYLLSSFTLYNPIFFVFPRYYLSLLSSVLSSFYLRFLILLILYFLQSIFFIHSLTTFLSLISHLSFILLTTFPTYFLNPLLFYFYSLVSLCFIKIPVFLPFLPSTFYICFNQTF